MSADPKLVKSPAELSALLLRVEAKGTQACNCSLLRCEGWDTMSESMWPKDQLRQLATLRDSNINEPTFEEYQPGGLRVDDPKALISIQHFPYNSCDVLACAQCNQAVMRYTEYGGYYVDHRARRVRCDQVIID